MLKLTPPSLPLRVGIFLFVVVVGLTAHAQFQTPNPEELKMTSDPKAPDAAAVILDYEESTNNVNNNQTYYERIKVLTEKGKELATVTIPYNKGRGDITDIKARTIHSDGAIFPLLVKPTDMVEVKIKDAQEHKIVFNLPNVEVGSILEYSWKVLNTWGEPPTWYIQEKYFVHQAHYSFTAAGGILWSAYLPKSFAVNNAYGGFYKLDITDIPPLPDEEYMLPIKSSSYNVDFYYSRFWSEDEFWKKAGKEWSNAVNTTVKPDHKMKDISEQILSPLPPSATEDAKAVKLYEAVQTLENTNFTRTHTAAEFKKDKQKEFPDHLEEIWNRKSGSSWQIALLYLALLHATDIKADLGMVVNRNIGILSKTVLSLYQFDDYVVIVHFGDKEVVTDPGEKMCPFSYLSWKHQNAGGLRQKDNSTAFFLTPTNTYRSAITMRKGDLTLDDQGQLTGTIKFQMIGPGALNWRQLALSNDEKEVKTQFLEALRSDLPDSIQPEFVSIENLDQPNKDLTATIRVAGQLGTRTGKRIFLPGLFLQSRAKYTFVATEKRQTAVDMHYAAMEFDRMVYHLPVGYTVESSPQQDPDETSKLVTFQIKSTVTENTVTVERTLARSFIFVRAEDYGQLRSLYQKIATADQQQLVLKPVATNK